MEITIICSVEEFNQIKHLVGNSNIIIKPEEIKYNYHKNIKQKRYNLIFQNIKTEHKIGSLYNTIRQKGYPMKYKTFTRDIENMKEDGLIIIKKIKNEKNIGITTLIKKRGVKND